MDGRTLHRRGFLKASAALVAGAAGLGAAPPPNTFLGQSPSGNLGEQYDHLEAIASEYPEVLRYIPLVVDAAEKHKGTFCVDPVLFLGLIKQESDFGKHLISPVGAAGPVQFMPATARDLGLKVYLPEPNYLAEAAQLNRRASQEMSEAIKLFRDAQWKRAVRPLKRSRKARAKARQLFGRYRKELEDLTNGRSDAQLRDIDERFVDSIAVEKAVAHLAGLLRSREGDVREALSAYNAGLGRVREWDGIPCIEETVVFQNRIVNFYRYWAPRAR